MPPLHPRGRCGPVRANGFMMLRALFLACTCGVLVCAKTPLTQLPASPAEFAWACTGPLARFPSLDGITPGDLVSFPTYQCFPRGITPPTEWDSNAWPLPVVNVLYDASFLDGAFAHTGARAVIESHISHYLPQLACADALPSGNITACTRYSPGLFIQFVDNSCSEQLGLANTFKATSVPRTKSIVVMGSSCSSSTGSAALVSSVFTIPIIGNMATSAEFSDKARYPYFTRTTYSVPDEIMSIFGFAAYYALQRVVLMTVSTSTGVTFASFAQERASSAGITIVRSLQFKESPSEAEVLSLLDVIAEVGVKTIIVHAVPTAEPILKQARLRGMMEDGWAWIMSGGSMSAYFGVIPPANADGVFMEVGHFDPSQPYSKQVYTLDKLSVKAYFNRSTPYQDLICDGMWDAGHSTLAAGSNLLDTAPGGSGALNYSQTVARLANGPLLLKHIRNITMPSACGDTLVFNPITADRLNPTMSIRKATLVNGKLNPVVVALWENGMFKPTAAAASMTWLGGATSAPSGVYERVLVDSGLSVAVLVLALLTMAASVGVSILVFVHRQAPVIKATTASFSLLIAFSCIVLSASAILFSIQPGGGVSAVHPVSGATLTDDPVTGERALTYPVLPSNHFMSTGGEVVVIDGTTSDAICVARVWLLPIGIILLLAPIALKSMRLTRIFNSTRLQVSTMPTSLLVKAVAGMLGIQALLCVLYTAGVGGAPKVELALRASDSTSSTLGTTEWMCHQSEWFIGSTIGYNGCIAFAVAVLAWRSRNLPAKFNEAQQLAALCVFIFIYCVLLLPLQFLLSSGRNPTSVSVLRSIGVLLGVWMTLVILFVPKVWQLREGGGKKDGATAATQQQLQLTIAASKYHDTKQDSALGEQHHSSAPVTAASPGDRTRSLLPAGNSSAQVAPLHRGAAAVTSPASANNSKPAQKDEAALLSPPSRSGEQQAVSSAQPQSQADSNGTHEDETHPAPLPGAPADD